jgi:hypothetical protein
MIYVKLFIYELYLSLDRFLTFAFVLPRPQNSRLLDVSSYFETAVITHAPVHQIYLFQISVIRRLHLENGVSLLTVFTKCKCFW